MMGKFKVGDEVVCISDDARISRVGIKGIVTYIDTLADGLACQVATSTHIELLFEYKLDFTDNHKFNNNFEKLLNEEN